MTVWWFFGVCEICQCEDSWKSHESDSDSNKWIVYCYEFLQLEVLNCMQPGVTPMRNFGNGFFLGTNCLCSQLVLSVSYCYLVRINQEAYSSIHFTILEQRWDPLFFYFILSNGPSVYYDNSWTRMYVYHKKNAGIQRSMLCFCLGLLVFDVLFNC